MSAWYLSAKDGSGRTFNWNKEPTYVCPLWEPTIYVPAPDGGEGGAHVLRDETADAVRSAAARLDVDPVLLGGLIKSGHQRRGFGRLRVDGRLTDLCQCCGHKMKREGFRFWIERPKTDADEETSADRINERLFGSKPTVIESVVYYSTKKDAEKRARREVAATERAR